MTPSPPSRLLLWLVASAFFMQMLDGTILNNALPSIAQGFGRSPIEMQMIVIAYLLTVAILIPVSGRLADRWGTRKTFFAAIVLFTLGSLLCALSISFGQLVVSRILQGVGGSMLVPVGRLIVLKVSPKHELIASLNFITIPGLIGPLIGPTLGGFLIEYASWRWIFLINVPIGALGAWFALRVVPDLKAVRQRFDWLGFILFGITAISVSLMFAGIGELRFSKFTLLTCFAFASTAFAGYIFSTLRLGGAAIFSAKLFSVRHFTIGIIGNLTARLANGSLPYLMPLLLQVALGYSALMSGLTLISLTVTAFLGKSLVEPLLKRFGFRAFLFGNTATLGIFIICFAFVSHSTSYGVILLLFGLLGTVNAMQFTAMNSLTLYDLPDDLKSDGNSLLSVVMQLSTSMGVAVASTFLLYFAGRETIDIHHTTLPFFQKTFIATGLIAIAASFVFLGVAKRKFPE